MIGKRWFWFNIQRQLENEKLVVAAGLEPATSSMSRKRATNCAKRPIEEILKLIPVTPGRQGSGRFQTTITSSHNRIGLQNRVKMHQPASKQLAEICWCPLGLQIRLQFGHQSHRCE